MMNVQVREEEEVMPSTLALLHKGPEEDFIQKWSYRPHLQNSQGEQSALVSLRQKADFRQWELHGF